MSQSAWDKVASLFEDSAAQTAEDVGTSALENGPDAIDAYSELQDMQQKIPLAEYEDLLENANQTGEEAVNDDFFPSFEELFQRVNGAFSPDGDDSDSVPDDGDDDGTPAPAGPDCGSTGCGG